MQILTVLLTVILVVDALFLGLLVLVQLPKKEAGIGMAFGGGAADALFGAGSGTALSALTKYTAILFFVLVLALSILKGRERTANVSDLKRALAAAVAEPAPKTLPSTTTPTAVPTASVPTVPMAASNTAATAATGASNAVPTAPVNK